MEELDMEKKEQLYEGKAKKVFATDDANLVIVDYKDDATAFNGEKKGTITGKGVINNVMSNHMFQLLEQQGVPTHFVEQLSERETLVKKVSIVPLEVIIRNISAGSFAKRFGRCRGGISGDHEARYGQVSPSAKQDSDKKRLKNEISYFKKKQHSV